MQKIIKQENGITLITLVITIIILSILVGISISSLTGDSGIIFQSKEVQSEIKRQTLIEDLKQNILLSQLSSSNNQISTASFTDILNHYGSLSDSKNLFDKILITNDGFEIKISELWIDELMNSTNFISDILNNVDLSRTNPASAIPKGASLLVENGELQNDLNKGIVIKDVNDNEWVWVEVPKTIMPQNLSFTTESDYKNLRESLRKYSATYCENITFTKDDPRFCLDR